MAGLFRRGPRLSRADIIVTRGRRAGLQGERYSFSNPYARAVASEAAAASCSQVYNIGIRSASRRELKDQAKIFNMANMTISRCVRARSNQAPARRITGRSPPSTHQWRQINNNRPPWWHVHGRRTMSS